jgi:hypothetical protein
VWPNMEFADSFEMAQGILEKQDRRVTLTKSRTTKAQGSLKFPVWSRKMPFC